MTLRLLVVLALVPLAGACAPSDLDADLDNEPEVLGGILPGVFSSSATHGGMLPAGQTVAEVDALGKADGWDWRDDDPYYAFTDKPDDVWYLPGEYEPVQALLMAYPSGSSDLKAFFVDTLEAASWSDVPKIVVYVETKTAANALKKALSYTDAELSKISFVKLALDSVWMRDYGPLLAVTESGDHRVIDFRYYYGRWDDDVAPTLLAEAWNLPVSRPPLEAEGGNFQSDGYGRCIATEWMVEQNYYYGYGQSAVKKILRDYLGCETTVILPALAGEGTGHVDMYVTITGPGEAIVGDYDSYDDPVNATVVDKAAKKLKNAGFSVRRVPMPYNADGVFRSYTNSLAVGDTVLVPVYPEDRRYEDQALAVFEQAYPGYEIIPIDASEIIEWAGAVHCVTMTIGAPGS